MNAVIERSANVDVAERLDVLGVPSKLQSPGELGVHVEVGRVEHVDVMAEVDMAAVSIGGRHVTELRASPSGGRDGIEPPQT